MSASAIWPPRAAPRQPPGRAAAQRRAAPSRSAPAVACAFDRSAGSSSERDARHERQRGRERSTCHGRADVAEARQAAGLQRPEPSTPARGEHHAERAARERQEPAPASSWRTDATAPGAQRHAQRELAAAARRRAPAAGSRRWRRRSAAPAPPRPAAPGAPCAAAPTDASGRPDTAPAAGPGPRRGSLRRAVRDGRPSRRAPAQRAPGREPRRPPPGPVHRGVPVGNRGRDRRPHLAPTAVARSRAGMTPTTVQRRAVDHQRAAHQRRVAAEAGACHSPWLTTASAPRRPVVVSPGAPRPSDARSAHHVEERCAHLERPRRASARRLERDARSP